MSEQLTVFERALLGQLEDLAKGSEASLRASKSTSGQLQDLSKLLTSRITTLEQRVAELEQREERVIEALNEQTQQAKKWEMQLSELLRRLNI